MQMEYDEDAGERGNELVAAFLEETLRAETEALGAVWKETWHDVTGEYDPTSWTVWRGEQSTIIPRSWVDGGYPQEWIDIIEQAFKEIGINLSLGMYCKPPN